MGCIAARGGLGSGVGCVAVRDVVCRAIFT